MFNYATLYFMFDKVNNIYSFSLLSLFITFESDMMQQ